MFCYISKWPHQLSITRVNALQFTRAAVTQAFRSAWEVCTYLKIAVKRKRKRETKTKSAKKNSKNPSAHHNPPFLPCSTAPCHALPPVYQPNNATSAADQPPSVPLSVLCSARPPFSTFGCVSRDWEVKP